MSGKNKKDYILSWAEEEKNDRFLRDVVEDFKVRLLQEGFKKALPADEIVAILLSVNPWAAYEKALVRKLSSIDFSDEMLSEYEQFLEYHDKNQIESSDLYRVLAIIKGRFNFQKSLTDFDLGLVKKEVISSAKKYDNGDIISHNYYFPGIWHLREGSARMAFESSIPTFLEKLRSKTSVDKTLLDELENQLRTLGSVRELCNYCDEVLKKEADKKSMTKKQEQDLKVEKLIKEKAKATLADQFAGIVVLVFFGLLVIGFLAKCSDAIESSENYNDATDKYMSACKGQGTSRSRCEDQWDEIQNYNP